MGAANFSFVRLPDYWLDDEPFWFKDGEMEQLYALIAELKKLTDRVAALEVMVGNKGMTGGVVDHGSVVARSMDDWTQKNQKTSMEDDNGMPEVS